MRHIALARAGVRAAALLQVQHLHDRPLALLQPRAALTMLVEKRSCKRVLLYSWLSTS